MINILANCDSGVPSQSSDTTTGRTDETMGYGNSGEFGMNQRTIIEDQPSGMHYVVAVSENNCMAISPVFDFSRITCDIQMVEAFKAKQPGDEDFPRAYKCKVWITNLGDIYYLRNYPFTVSLMYTDNASHAVLSTAEVEAGNNSAAYLDITYEQFEGINEDYFWPYIRLTDCTTLRHMIGPYEAETFNVQEREIEWQTNEGYWCIKPFRAKDTLGQQTVVPYDNPEDVYDTESRQLYKDVNSSENTYYLNYNINDNQYWGTILKKRKNSSQYYTFKGWATAPD